MGDARAAAPAKQVDGAVHVADRARALGRFWWLVDAPIFLDGPLVDRLYDAVVHPNIEVTEEEEKRYEDVKTTIAGQAEASAKADLKLPDFLTGFFPTKAGGEAKLATQGEKIKKFVRESVKRGVPIDSPDRRLSELVLYYLLYHSDRLLFVDAPGGEYSNLWGAVSHEDVATLLDRPPRPLVFVDVHQGAAIMPTMAELEGGSFKPIFADLEGKFFEGLEPKPKYPSDDQAPDAEEQRRAYWGALRENFRSRDAMQAIEKAVEKGRIGWIDFRILFRGDGETAHLHAVPGGRFHTGVFAYNFVHRGARHGCRLLGTLKSGNDVNVLAIYER